MESRVAITHEIFAKGKCKLTHSNAREGGKEITTVKKQLNTGHKRRRDGGIRYLENVWGLH